MNELMRFGLMTFDQDPSPASASSAPLGPVQPAPTRVPGMWSYYPGWNTGGSCTYLGQTRCNCTHPVASLGGRRAQPGGPAVGGPHDARSRRRNDLATQEHEQRRDVASVILATRPYGATPLAGMFRGASTTSGTTRTARTARRQHRDPFAQGGCRPEYIILLTDGAPNLDMQPSCSRRRRRRRARQVPLPAAAGHGGARSTTTASHLGQALGHDVRHRLRRVDHRRRDHDGELLAVRRTATARGPLQLQRPEPARVQRPDVRGHRPVLRAPVHRAGRRQQARRTSPTPRATCNNALGAILGSIAANATTRTTPSYSPVISSSVAEPEHAHHGGVGLPRVASRPRSARPGRATSSARRAVRLLGQQLHRHAVDRPRQRRRLRAEPELARGPPRNFIAFQPDVNGSGQVDASATIRPYVVDTVGDGLGQYSATTYAGAAAVGDPEHHLPGAGHPQPGCPYVAQHGRPTHAAGDVALRRRCCSTTRSGSRRSRAGRPTSPSCRATATRSATSSTRTPSSWGRPARCCRTRRTSASSRVADDEHDGVEPLERAQPGAQDRRLRGHQRRPAPRVLGGRDEAGEQRAVGDAAARGDAAPPVDLPVEPRVPPRRLARS